MLAASAVVGSRLPGPGALGPPASAAVLLLASVALLAAPSETVAGTTCTAPAGARVVVASASAVVYTKRVAPRSAPETPSAVLQRYWGWVRSVGRLRHVVDMEPLGEGVSSHAERFRLAGSLAAFATVELDHYGGRRASITAIDLRRPTRRRTAPAGDGQQGGPGGPERPLAIRALRITRAGGVIWLTRANAAYFGPTVDRLSTFSRTPTPRTLDISAPGLVRNMALDRLRVTWRNAGAARTATVAPFWQVARS